jgi:predicted ATPase
LLDEPATHLLTLTGSGGCGKTRLALRTGRNMAGAFPHGAWLVELAPLSEPALMPQALVAVLGLVVTSGRQPVEVLTGFLKEHHTLIILDNCEHLIDATARLVLDLLRASPGLKILATSREPLGVPGEVTYRVPSLALPPPDWDGSSDVSPAVQLFLERARSIEPSFILAERDFFALAYICRRLDGIPLAIELAAARISALSVSLIALRLEEGFRVLGPGSRGAVPRHATLRATVDWSYNLLSEPERVLLRRLPFFAGGWTLKQAEEVCACGGIAPEDVIDLLAMLVNKSLVSVERREDGTMRYRLHEIVRQYARERLSEAGEEEDLRVCFVDCLTRLAEAAEPELKCSHQGAWRARLSEEEENLTEALNLAVLHQDVHAALRLTGALAYYWTLRDRVYESARWLDAALALPGSQDMLVLPARAKAIAGRLLIAPYSGIELSAEFEIASEQACLALGDESLLAFVRSKTYHQGDSIALYTQLRDSLPRLRSAGEHWIATFVLDWLQDYERSTVGDFAAGRAYLLEAVAHARASGDSYRLSMLMSQMSWLEWDVGNVRKARESAEEALRMQNEAGVLTPKIFTCFYVSYFDAAMGNFAEAYDMLQDAIRIAYSLGNVEVDQVIRLMNLNRLYCLDGRFSEAKEEYERALVNTSNPVDDYKRSEALQYLGLALLHQGHLEQAAQVLAESLALAEKCGNHLILHGPLRSMGMTRLAQGDLPAARDLLFRSFGEITSNRTLPDFPENLDPLAGLALALGHPTQAAHLLGASDGLLQRMEIKRYPAFQPEYERWREAARAALGETTFTSAYAYGFSLASLSDPIEPILAILEE